VEYVIKDPGKTISFKLRPKDFQVPVWSGKKAKREHREQKSEAKKLLRAEWHDKKRKEKQRRRKLNRGVPSIVVDSAATSTVIRSIDEKYVTVLDEPSTKVFKNANGTESRAGKKAKLDYNMRDPAFLISPPTRCSVYAKLQMPTTSLYSQRMKFKSSMLKQQRSTLKAKQS
jgi:hypothetical protein